jgi:hypothetical protein
MRTAVHTRRIIDPSWGSKLTGTAGHLTFGLLDASDESPENPVAAGRNKYFNIGRATYALGKSDYVGGIVTDTELAGRHNRVEGGDVSLKFSPPQQFSATFLSSQTGSTHAIGSQVSYSYNTHRISMGGQVEHYGRDFQMDTAFYNRTGFTSGWFNGEVSFYPREGGSSWLQRTYLSSFVRRGRDQVQNGNEDFQNVNLGFNFTRQGYLNLGTEFGHEPWLGRRFETGALFNMSGGAQIFRALNINGSFSRSRNIFYDPDHPFQGRTQSGSFGFSLQPNAHIQQDVNYNGVRFTRASNGERIYTVHIVNTQSTYQFNRHFRLRLLEQFDSSQRQILTDFLAMYEVVPGTVLDAGYGSLAASASPGARYATVTRGLFFKASYRWRF